VTGDFYIGSAVTNKFYSRFYKHLIKGLGNKNISIDLNKYGIDSFALFILARGGLPPRVSPAGARILSRRND
jgi:hypothetical protein